MSKKIKNRNANHIKKIKKSLSIFSLERHFRMIFNIHGSKVHSYFKKKVRDIVNR